MQLAIKRCLVFSLLAVLAILFIDRPLGLWVHKEHLDDLLFFRHITEGLPIVLPIAALLLVIFIKPAVNIGNKWLYIVYIFLLTKTTVYAKEGLKGIFSRYWLKTWINNNLSLIHDNVSGFNWFGGFDYNGGSFPSGHTTFISIICLSLAITYPKLKILWYFLIILMIFSLIILDYHFLGDAFGALALSSLFTGFGFVFYQYLMRKFANK